jgi:hypothetical protein
MKLNRLALLLMLLLAGVTLQAAPVKISFLNDEVALRETMSILRANGCRKDAISSFKFAVDHYNAIPPKLDLEKFPQRLNGFYSFISASNLIEALPYRLYGAPHPYEINCFDTVILLTKGCIHIGLQADEIYGPFLSPYTETNNYSVMRPAATPRDAFAVTCPAWYTNITCDVMESVNSNTRICLTASFFSFRCLPNSTTENNLSQTVWKILTSDWKKQKLEFPKNMQVVLCYGVNFPQRIMLTGHAGLLFRIHNHYVFIEKTGGSGPFVRFDFEDRADLNLWLAKEFNGLGWTHLFATFNDKEIEEIKVN